MRKLIIFVLLLAALTLSCRKEENYSYDKPESVIWNPVTGAYLISNVGSGQILSLKGENPLSLFNQTGLNSPKGMTILGKVLYVADVDHIIGLNLENGKRVFRLKIPNAGFLNDIAVSPDSIAYVSDTKRDVIFIVNLIDKKIERFTDGNLTSPNGLNYMQGSKGRFLYICSFRIEAPLQVLNLESKTLSNVPGVNVSMADGLTRDQEGNWYISCWEKKTIYRFSPEFESKSVFKDEYPSAADISFSLENKELAIPQLDINRIIFIKAEDIPDKIRL